MNQQVIIAPRTRRTRTRLCLALAATGLMGYALASWCAAWWSTAPRTRGASPAPPPIWRLEWLPTGEELSLATYRRDTGRRPLVIVAHGYHGSARRVLSVGTLLWKSGYDVWLFDFRGHGSSGGDAITGGVLEAGDMEAVLEAARAERGSLRSVGLVAFSMGAAAAVMAPATGSVGACVLVGCYDTLENTLRNRYRVYFGVDFTPLDWLFRRFAELRTGCRLEDARPVDHVERLDATRVLIVHGTLDRHVGPDVGARLLEAVGPGAELFEYAGDHWTLAHLAERPPLRDAVLEFLDRTL